MSNPIDVTLYNLKVLDSIVRIYGMDFTVSLNNLAGSLKTNPMTLRHHIIRLRKYGFLSTENSTTKTITYHVNERMAAPFMAVYGLWLPSTFRKRGRV